MLGTSSIGQNLAVTTLGKTITQTGILTVSTVGGILTISTLAPRSTPSGNRYIFSTQPSVTVTTTSTSKTYGTDITATVATLFNISAFVNAATYASIFTQDTTANALTGVAPTSAGASPTASVLRSPYAVTSSATATTGTGLSSYIINYIDGLLVINLLQINM